MAHFAVVVATLMMALSIGLAIAQSPLHAPALTATPSASAPSPVTVHFPPSPFSATVLPNLIIPLTSSIATPPRSEAPGPAQNVAVSNRFAIGTLIAGLFAVALVA